MRILFLFTSADLEEDRDHRSLEYKKGFESVQKFFTSRIDCELVIVETARKRNTLTWGNSVLIIHAIPVFRRFWSNKGALLVRSLRILNNNLLKKSIHSHVVLYTGRYEILSESFVSQIKIAFSINPEFPYLATKDATEKQFFTGAIVVRRDLLISFIEKAEVLKWEFNKISLEQAVFDFLVNYEGGFIANELGISANVWGQGKRNHILV